MPPLPWVLGVPEIVHSVTEDPEDWGYRPSRLLMHKCILDVVVLPRSAPDARAFPRARILLAVLPMEGSVDGCEWYADIPLHLLKVGQSGLLMGRSWSASWFGPPASISPRVPPEDAAPQQVRYILGANTCRNLL